MHCAAGDGLGIIAGAAIAAQWSLPRWADLSLEYALGFGFGWAFFQAFAMREMAGSYGRSLRMTFLPEFVSMNLLMTGMILTMRLLRPQMAGAGNPLALTFWFVISMSLVAGFVFAYPVNWCLVSRGLKHGMITVRPPGTKVRTPPAASITEPAAQAAPPTRHHITKKGVHRGETALIILLSVLSLAIVIAFTG